MSLPVSTPVGIPLLCKAHLGGAQPETPDETGAYGFSHVASPFFGFLGCFIDLGRGSAIYYE